MDFFTTLWQFILFSLGVFAITSIIRRLVDFALANWDKSRSKNKGKFWNDVVLPSLPGLLGALLGGLFKQYPYPPGITSLSARIVFGLAAGLLCGVVYRVVRSFITTKATTEQQEKIANDTTI